MWKSERVYILLASWLAVSAAHADFFGTRPDTNDPGSRSQTIEAQRKRIRNNKDSEELRAAVDDTQALFDALALESGRLGEPAHQELYADLREGYHLPGAVDGARHALAYAEELLRLKGGIKSQQEKVEATAILEREPEENRLLGLKSDQMALLEDLRKVLRGLHKDLNEDQIRDLRNWAMVSEGVLRRRHEDEDLKNTVQKEAEALPVDASATGLSQTPSTSAETPSEARSGQAHDQSGTAKGKTKPKASAKDEADPR